jgi:hypothetical protein
MTSPAKLLALLIPLTFLANSSPAQQATITAELAKKCRELAIKAHPTPKAGTKATGAEKAQRDYFSTCISKGGKMDDEQH